MMQSRKLSPRRALSPFVSYLRVTDNPRATRLPYLRLPDGQLELTLRLGDSAQAIRLVGTRTRALRKSSDPGHVFVSVRFKPGGAYPFFGVPLSALTDQLVDLEALWHDDARRLADTLRATESGVEGVDALQRALCARLLGRVFEPASTPAVRRALRYIAAASALPSVEELARELGASTRQLRRAFLEVVGIGPKQYLRVVRFQRALRILRTTPRANMAATARAAGYYDQSHLHAEFQELAEVTPRALRRALAP